MLISFVGCPCSGKTTTAAKVFSSLKETGDVAEFITEQARFFIAEKRVTNKLTPDQKVDLTDSDQSQIMDRQFRLEQLLLQACSPKTIIVSDSSVLNAILYMSDDEIKSNEEKITTAVSGYDIIFHTMPINDFKENDSNRVHDRDFSYYINSKVNGMLTTFAPKNHSITLSGSPSARYSQAMAAIYEKCSRA